MTKISKYSAYMFSPIEVTSFDLTLIENIFMGYLPFTLFDDHFFLFIPTIVKPIFTQDVFYPFSRLISRFTIADYITNANVSTKKTL